MKEQKSLDNKVKRQKYLSYIENEKKIEKKVNSFLNEHTTHKYQMGKIMCELNIKNMLTAKVQQQSSGQLYGKHGRS